MFLKLTQIVKGYDDTPVWVQHQHIVAIYPDRKGVGCHIELVTSSDAEQPIMHVSELADQIGQSCGPWNSFPAPQPLISPKEAT
tara:strand:- start:232 stop:483 length:252 start_codon:yes stop_codon:yes gene_type:complete